MPHLHTCALNIRGSVAAPTHKAALGPQAFGHGLLQVCVAIRPTKPHSPLPACAASLRSSNLEACMRRAVGTRLRPVQGWLDVKFCRD